MPSKFFRVTGQPTVYEMQADGSYQGIPNPEDFQRRAGVPLDQAQIENYSTLPVDPVAQYNQDVADSQSYAKGQVAAQVDPNLTSTETDLNNEKTLAQDQANRLQDAVAQVYKSHAQNNQLSAQGIASGAQQGYQTDAQAKEVSNIGTDLSNKLSYIAQRLTNARSAASTQKSALERTLSDQYLQNRVSQRNTAQDRQLQAVDTQRSGVKDIASIYSTFLGSKQPIPEAIYNLLVKTYGGY